MNYLVFDVGGTEIKYALMNGAAEILEKQAIPTPLDSLETFLSSLEGAYEKYKGRAGGIALSLPGRIDSGSGFVYSGGSLHYNDIQNIAEKVKERCGLPVAVENDGKCAALAEALSGNLKDCENGIVVILGTGIGGGIILNKKLYKGSHFAAGEFSYIITDSAKYADLGIPNRFGYHCSVPLLCKLVAYAKHMPEENVNGHVVFELANGGDKDALEILDGFCETLANNLMNLQFIFDVEKIAIGGGISSQDLLFECLRKHIENQAAAMAMAKFAIVTVPELVPCKFRNDSNLVGALYNFFSNAIG